MLSQDNENNDNFCHSCTLTSTSHLVNCEWSVLEPCRSMGWPWLVLVTFMHINERDVKECFVDSSEYTDSINLSDVDSL